MVLYFINLSAITSAEQILFKLQCDVVYCTNLRSTLTKTYIKEHDIKGIIIYGFESTISYLNKLIPINIFDLGIPILGICFGMHHIINSFNGKFKHIGGEVHNEMLFVLNKNKLFEGVVDGYKMYNNNYYQTLSVHTSYSNQVVELPDGFELIASTRKCKIAAFQNIEKQLYGIQFLPDLSVNSNCYNVLLNFAFNICNAKYQTPLYHKYESIFDEIKTIVKNEKVLLCVCGMTSFNLAYILKNVLGKQLLCIYLHTPVSDKDEYMKTFLKFKTIGITIDNIYDDSNILLQDDIHTIEDKTKKIRDVYLRLTYDAIKHNNIKFIVPTLFDTILNENYTNFNDHCILNNKILNTLFYLNCVQLTCIRKLDLSRTYNLFLNLPCDISRHNPFYGKYLRIHGSVTENKIDIVKKTDQILMDTLNERADSSSGLMLSYTINIAYTALMAQNNIYYTNLITNMFVGNLMISDVNGPDDDLLNVISNIDEKKINNNTKHIELVLCINSIMEKYVPSNISIYGSYILNDRAVRNVKNEKKYDYFVVAIFMFQKFKYIDDEGQTQTIYLWKTLPIEIMNKMINEILNIKFYNNDYTFGKILLCITDEKPNYIMNDINYGNSIYIRLVEQYIITNNSIPIGKNADIDLDTLTLIQSKILKNKELNVRKLYLDITPVSLT